ncbi:MAG: hypothetical protein OQK54_05735 [Gammaproteobacteria bacterium]|nr:hypothetical protein [Gammaproteobacteria bacterium]
MDNRIILHKREIAISLSDAASKALAQRATPLLAEMELYFSCLIRKAVRFYETPTDDSLTVNDKLQLRFRPVMTRHCGTDYSGDEPPLTDFPITQAERYVPHWLTIDYKDGQWRGEFGYAEKQA